MGCRTGGNQNCRDSRLEGFRTGGMQEREIQERRDAERESQDWKDTGKDGSGQ